MDKKNVVVVFGAGASHDSGYCVRLDGRKIMPPTDRNFFEALSSVGYSLDRDYLSLSEFIYQYYKNCKSLEALWTELDLNHKHIGLGTFLWTEQNASYLLRAIMHSNPNINMDIKTSPGAQWPHRYNEHKFTGDCGRDLRRLVFNIFFDFELSSGLKSNYKKLDEIIMQSDQCRLLGYITFNYDCFLEHSLEHFRYIKNNELLNFREIVRQADVNRRIELNYNNHKEIKEQAKKIILKLHGSLNWKHSNYQYEDVQFASDPFFKDQQVECRYEDDDHWKQAAIIPPTIFKQEINYDSGQRDKLSLTILNQWRNAIKLLEHSDKILFVGYSLPETDFHVKRLFRLARMIKGKTPIQILVVLGERNDKTIQEVDAFQEKIYDIFGKQSEPIFEHTFSKLVNDGQCLQSFLKTG